MYTFGQTSLKNLATCHLDLQKIAKLAIRRSPVDFGIHAGARTIAAQQKFFDQKASQINPRDYKSPEDLAAKAKHITIPIHPEYKRSRAFDFHISKTYGTKNLMWDDIHLSIVIGVIYSCALELYERDQISSRIRSGGDWDKDGIFVYDHTLKDLPHIEIFGR